MLDVNVINLPTVDRSDVARHRLGNGVEQAVRGKKRNSRPTYHATFKQLSLPSSTSGKQETIVNHVMRRLGRATVHTSNRNKMAPLKGTL